MKKPRCVYSLDWLQLYCNCYGSQSQLEAESIVSPQADKHGNHRTYSFAQAHEYIKGYAFNKAVVYRKYTVAIIAWSPRNSNNDPYGCAIKIQNAVLYVADWHFILADILASLGWRALSITRLDLACDLNYFLNGLHPETFIRKYMMRSGQTYLRDGSNKWACYGYKELHVNNFDSIRWGSRKSGVSVYLYNKSKELKEQKYKPYIVEAWKQAALNVYKVWRVEMSINSSGRGLKSVDTGFVRSLFVDELSCQQGVENMFKVFAKKYFSFRKVENGGPKRKKDMPHVELLDYSQETLLKPTTLYHSAKSTLKESIVIRELMELKEQLWAEHGCLEKSMQDSLSAVMEEYSKRSFLAHKCKQEGRAVVDALNLKIDEHLTLDGYRQRYKNAKDLISDHAYMMDIAKRITKKLEEEAMQGVLL